jgi:signal transduction histidine kinase
MENQKLLRLVQFSRQLSSYAELETLVQSIVDVAAELTAAQGAALLLYDEEEKILRYVAASWFQDHPNKRAALESVPIPINSSITGWVFQKSSPRALEKTDTTPQLVSPGAENHLLAPVTSIAAAPLSYQKVTIGVLECYNAAAKKFSSEDVEILETLASQAAVSIYNAHLLHKTQVAYENLAELDRMKSDFIAITSHELRTPLGVIIGHTTIVREMVDDDLEPQMAIIERNALQLKEIIENLTAMNDIGTEDANMNLEKLSYTDLITAMLHNFGAKAKQKKVSLRANFPKKNIQITGDKDKLNIAIGNIIKNAIDFTPEQGQIMVSIRVLNNHVETAVQDSGIGIPSRDIGRIFERFYQVEGHMRRKHGGMGVGLSVAKYMVELHGGKIWVASKENEGSKFTFTLPLMIEQPKTSSSNVFITS